MLFLIVQVVVYLFRLVCYFVSDFMIIRLSRSKLFDSRENNLTRGRNLINILLPGKLLIPVAVNIFYYYYRVNSFPGRRILIRISPRVKLFLDFERRIE